MFLDLMEIWNFLIPAHIENTVVVSPFYYTSLILLPISQLLDGMIDALGGPPSLNNG